MINLQLVRNGIPDIKFFGNTFIAMSLAQRIDDSLLVAKEKTVVKQKELWKELLKVNLGINLQYCDYVKNDILGTNTSFTEFAYLMKNKDEPLVVNFHFGETDLEEKICGALPKEFGNDVKQYLHLHCSSDFFLKNDKQRKNRISNIKRAIDKGYIKKFIAVSYQVRESFIGIIPEEMMEVVHNGIPEDIYSFREEPEKDAFKNQYSIKGDFLVGYSGRLDTVKGYEDLIKIMKWFDKRPEFDIGFVVATSGGKGLNRTRRKIIKGSESRLDCDLRLNAPRLLKEGRIGLVLDVAKYAGNTKNLNSIAYKSFNNHMNSELKQKSPLYRGITPVPLQAMVDVYIQPSESEAFGLAALEALFTGTPVIGHRVGGLPEVITGPLGTLIDYHQKQQIRVNQFCEAIVQSITTNYGIEGRKNTVEFRRTVRERLIPKFSASVMAKKVEEIYKK